MVALLNRQWVCSKDTWFVDGVGFFWSHAVSRRTWLGDIRRQIRSLFVDKDFREGGARREVPATTGPSAGAETRPPVQGRSETGEEVEFSVAATALKLQGRATTPLNRGEPRRRPRRRRRRKKKRRRCGVISIVGWTEERNGSGVAWRFERRCHTRVDKGLWLHLPPSFRIRGILSPLFAN